MLNTIHRQRHGGRRVRMAWLAAACVALSTAAGAGTWRSVGTGDCPGRDVAGSPGAQPEGGRCDAAFAGFTAVCWAHGCTYKNLPTGQCTGGANPGRMYTCQADAPPVNLGNWRSVGTGDCPGRDVGGSSGPQPDPARCNAGFGGFTAVCWGQNCTYKNLPTGQCTGGANPGRMYTCQASTTSSGTGSPGAGSNSGHTGATSGGTSPTPAAPPQGTHYAVVNHVGDTRNPHDFIVDWSQCRVTELNEQFSRGRETIKVSVCRPNSRLVMRTDFLDSGYWIQYDWVLLDDGATVAGSYRDAGTCGPSAGKRVR